MFSEAAVGRFLKHMKQNTCNFIKKKLQHKCFPVNIMKILRIAFL